MNKDSWEILKLGQICEIISGSTPKTNINEYWNGKYNWVTPAELNDELDTIYDTQRKITAKAIKETNLKLLPKGAILLSSRAPIGKVAIAGNDMYSNQGFKNLICSKKIYNRYLFRFLKGKTEYLNSLGRGATFKEISKEIVSNIPIPIPPISLQEQIVKELDTLSDIINKKKEQLAELDKLAQATFYDMFGDPVENEKEWNNKLWSEVLTIYNGKNQKKVENKNGEYPICGSGGIMGYADAYICPENTVIIGRKGNINKPIFMRKKFWNVDTAFGLVANYNELNPNFLFYFCLNYNFEKHNKAVTIPSLTKTDLLKIAMPCPPLSLQNQFAEKIEAIEQQKALINQSITDTQLLFDYTMDKYFN
ncbi:restriction endonuclease subunit S [Snodgrassella alvi]|uniref:restriction endonuclease subunit S n=1 Tax=Snodgrassella alvi TaxID=1196083 RepID=UPI00351C44E9